MNISLFTDLIDSLSKVFAGLKTVVNLPKDQRDSYRQVMEETYRLIDSTLLMVILRLREVGDRNDEEIRDELMRLGDFYEWLQVEREFRICRSLSIALREAESLPQRFAKLAITDWEGLVKQMNASADCEERVAKLVADQCKELAETAIAASDSTSIAALREQLTKFREALIQEHKELTSRQVELYKLV